MAIPSTQASNASIYTTYGVFLVFGLVVAWRFSNRKEFLAAIRSQPAIPLAFNFIASDGIVTRDSVHTFQFICNVLLLWLKILSGILCLSLRALVLKNVISMISRTTFVHYQLADAEWIWTCKNL
ncbi:hypothetical protein V1519DRAFT_382958 [Lipomyces tetrasporus]